MSDISILEEIIKAALPSRSMFGKENFAGDPEVKIFYNSLLHQYDLNIEIYVSWFCDPSAMLLQSVYGNVLVRSERMDTLLIEYIHLKKVLHDERYSLQILSDVAGATVLQWISEFFIGHELPSHALSAWELSRKVSTVHMSTHPYRDESLASVSEDLRVSLQCFSIAHEIGHILHPKKENASLNEVVDGLELMKHVEHDFREAKITSEAREVLEEQIIQQINVTTLVNEIDAGLFALHCVISFLIQSFVISLEDAVRNALYAFEALAYMNACKYDCSLLKRNQETPDLKSRSFINGTELSIRSRCVMRRSGILWAHFDNPDKDLKAADISKYVPLVDNLYLGSQNLLQLLTQKTVDYLDQFHQEFKDLTIKEKTSKFKQQMHNLGNTPKQRYELWKILIAYGCSGGTDVNTFFEEQFSLKAT